LFREHLRKASVPGCGGGGLTDKPRFLA